MSIEPELLELLRCPVTGERLQLLEPTCLDVLNRQIQLGKVVDRSGRTVDRSTQAALVNQSRTLLAMIEDQIVNLLADELIPTETIEGFPR